MTHRFLRSSIFTNILAISPILLLTLNQFIWKMSVATVATLVHSWHPHPNMDDFQTWGSSRWHWMWMLKLLLDTPWKGLIVLYTFEAHQFFSTVAENHHLPTCQYNGFCQWPVTHFQNEASFHRFQKLSDNAISSDMCTNCTCPLAVSAQSCCAILSSLMKIAFIPLALALAA